MDKERKTIRFVFQNQKKSRHTRRHSRKDTGRSWVLEMKEVVWKSKVLSWKKAGFNSVSDGTAIQGSKSPSLHKCQSTESWNSVRTLKGKETIHFNADASNTKLLFRIFHSVNPLSIYGAIRFDRRRKKDKKELSTKENPWAKENYRAWNHKKWSFLYLLQDKHLETVSRENIQDFESLSGALQFTRVCEDASFWYRVSAGMRYKTKPDEDDGSGQIIPLCQEYTLSSVNPRSSVFAAIPGGTTIGPVIEVQILKILANFGLGIAIPSPNGSKVDFMFWYPREGVDSWTNACPICRTYSHQRGIVLRTWKRKWKRTLCGASEDWHPRNWMRSRPVYLFTKRTILTTENEWNISLAKSSRAE